jgi:hypothetical protein
MYINCIVISISPPITSKGIVDLVIAAFFLPDLDADQPINKLGNTSTKRIITCQ